MSARENSGIAVISKVRVKICGIRTLEEARAALDLGADAIGLNFWESSPRYIEPAAAGEIIEALPPFFSCIGVFVNEAPEKILEIADLACLDGVQLHGDESPDYCRELRRLRMIKALRVDDSFDLNLATQFPVSAILLDTHISGTYGGTGERFDWGVAARAAKLIPVILAGGLNHKNVREAIETVRPFGVDVCSGVEAEPGRKDLDKMRLFMQEVTKSTGDHLSL